MSYSMEASASRVDAIGVPTQSIEPAELTPWSCQEILIFRKNGRNHRCGPTSGEIALISLGVQASMSRKEAPVRLP